MDTFTIFSVAMRIIGYRKNIKEIYDVLLARYSEPHRHYHTWAHIEAGLKLIYMPEVRPRMKNPHWVAIAYFFHDVIYVPGAKDNEEKSAALCLKVLSEGDVDSSIINEIYLLIRCTDHLTSMQNHSVERQVITDVDLAPLGYVPEEFDETCQKIRLEYKKFPDDQYAAGRKEFFQALLDRQTIFCMSYFQNHLEAQARANLKREISRL